MDALCDFRVFLFGARSGVHVPQSILPLFLLLVFYYSTDAFAMSLLCPHLPIVAPSLLSPFTIVKPILLLSLRTLVRCDFLGTLSLIIDISWIMILITGGFEAESLQVSFRFFHCRAIPLSKLCSHCLYPVSPINQPYLCRCCG